MENLEAQKGQQGQPEMEQHQGSSLPSQAGAKEGNHIGALGAKATELAL